MNTMTSFLSTHYLYVTIVLGVIKYMYKLNRTRTDHHANFPPSNIKTNTLISGKGTPLQKKSTPVCSCKQKLGIITNSVSLPVQLITAIS